MNYTSWRLEETGGGGRTLRHRRQANEEALSAPAAAVTQMCSVYWEEWLGRPFCPYGLLAVWQFVLTPCDGGLVAVCPELCQGVCLSLGFLVATSCS